ncbi:MAG TPA: lytic transglycosylase domain-containing protein [Pyrinomonadaceae bacterium]|nr:lytic transglycosylase domain-containing protein [Pyrinomonadaceae bacterium]
MRIFSLPLLLVLFGTTALAQSQSYSIDNFDFRNGVRVEVAAPPTRIALQDPRRPKVRSSAKQTSVASPETSSLVKPTILFTDQPVSIASTGASSLRGYTTGSAQVDSYLIDSGTRNGVDPLLLYSVMHQESSFKSHAVSPKGARGLMQLMPGTAARFGVTSIFEPRQNIEGGARYLRFLLDRFDGDVNLALAGYNAGEGAVEKFGGRIPPYSETQEYVRRISRRYSLIQDPNSALYAQRVNRSQVAKLQAQQPTPLALYERTVSTIRLPDGRLQLMSQ